MIPANPNLPAIQPQFSLQVAEAASSNLDVSVKRAPIILPETQEGGGNTMKCLENALLQTFGHDPKKLSVNDRGVLLKELLPNVTNFHGKLPKANSNKADSPVEFETYTIPKYDKNGKVIIDSKTGEPEVFKRLLKVKMTWQMEVNVGGKKETVELVQYVNTGCSLPKNLSELTSIEHAKRTALLYAKVHRKLHKKALLGSNYNSDVIKGERMDHLIKNLKASNKLNITHYPSPLTLQGVGRALTGRLTLERKDGPVNDSVVEFEGSKSKVYLSYANEYGVKGRKIKTFKPGDTLPNGTDKAAVLMTKFVKLTVPQKNDDEEAYVTPYGEHLYNQGSNITIKDPIFNAFQNIAKSSSQNVISEIQNNPGVELNSYRKYQKALLNQDVTNFDIKENRIRSQLLSSGGPLNMIRQLFAQNRTVRGIVDQGVQGLAAAIAKVQQAPAGSARTAALKELEESHKNLEGLQDQIKELKKARDEIERRGLQLEALGPVVEEDQKLNKLNVSTFKGQIASYKKNVKLADERLDVYKALNGPEMMQAKMLLMPQPAQPAQPNMQPFPPPATN